MEGTWHSPDKPGLLVPPCCGCTSCSAPGSSRWRRSRWCHRFQRRCPNPPSPEPNPQSLPLQGPRNESTRDVTDKTKGAEVLWTLRMSPHRSASVWGRPPSSGRELESYGEYQESSRTRTGKPCIAAGLKGENDALTDLKINLWFHWTVLGGLPIMRAV